MASNKTAVGATANFEANLAGIEAFWIETGAPRAYDALLDRLLDGVIPNLERFPKIGRPFLARPGLSAESRVAIERLKARAGRAEIREYLIDDYLVLYALIAGTAYLLAIRHHRQLSFDFQGFWGT
ncbi:MAG: type II toxin-antitoxin system RelE/ParE family toxin [Comamonadaceae bacterium]|nr:type II toxin-antitoxin system RelE/ParE family toxin [Comamonadaceae bacterium]